MELFNTGKSQSRHNIIIFGEAGAGKSSVVNMLVGRDVAKTSNSGGNCTKTSDPYNFEIDDCHFRIFDTAGFNEGEQNRPPPIDAIIHLVDLVRTLDGVSLLVYCMRAPWMKESSTANWKLFHDIVCQKKVPIIAVVTGLEELGKEMDEWWPRNKGVFRGYGLNPLDVACITAIKGKRGAYEEEYNESKTTLRNMILENRMDPPWHADKDSWWSDLWKGYLDSLWQDRGGKGGLGEPTLEDLVDGCDLEGLVLVDLVVGCGLDLKEAKKISETLKTEPERRVFFGTKVSGF